MNSRIFQIETNPIPKKDYIAECNFDDHWFLDTIADYVADYNDRDQNIEWLRSFLEKKKAAAFDDSSNSFVILPNGKQAYFLHAYEDFVQARDKTQGMSIAEFSSEISKFSTLLWKMNDAYCTKYGLYVSSEEFALIPFDEFIRQAEIGTHYHIGGVLSYKF